MTRIQATAVRDNFADVVNRVAYKGERFMLERRGKAVAALVPVEDLVRLEELEDRLDAKEGARVLRQMKAKGEKPIPVAEMKRRLGIE